MNWTLQKAHGEVRQEGQTTLPQGSNFPVAPVLSFMGIRRALYAVMLAALFLSELQFPSAAWRQTGTNEAMHAQCLPHI